MRHIKFFSFLCNFLVDQTHKIYFKRSSLLTIGGSMEWGRQERVPLGPIFFINCSFGTLIFRIVTHPPHPLTPPSPCIQKQECIPVGYVPPALYRTGGGGVSVQGVSVWGRVSLSGGLCQRDPLPFPPWTDRRL